MTLKETFENFENFRSKGINYFAYNSLVVVVVACDKMEEDFENFCSNEPFGNFAINCNKLANEIDLDPLRVKLKAEKDIAT